MKNFIISLICLLLLLSCSKSDDLDVFAETNYKVETPQFNDFSIINSTITFTEYNDSIVIDFVDNSLPVVDGCYMSYQTNTIFYGFNGEVDNNIRVLHIYGNANGAITEWHSLFTISPIIKPDFVIERIDIFHIGLLNSCVEHSGLSSVDYTVQYNMITTTDTERFSCNGFPSEEYNVGYCRGGESLFHKSFGQLQLLPKKP